MVQQGLDWAVAIVYHCYIMETVCKTKSKNNNSIDNSKSNAKAKSLLILIKEKNNTEHWLHNNSGKGDHLTFFAIELCTCNNNLNDSIREVNLTVSLHSKNFKVYISFLFVTLPSTSRYFCLTVTHLADGSANSPKFPSDANDDDSLWQRAG